MELSLCPQFDSLLGLERNDESETRVSIGSIWLAPNPCSISIDWLQAQRQREDVCSAQPDTSLESWVCCRESHRRPKKCGLLCCFDCRNDRYNNVADSWCELTQVPLAVRPVLLDPTPVQVVRRCG